MRLVKASGVISLFFVCSVNASLTACKAFGGDFDGDLAGDVRFESCAERTFWSTLIKRFTSP